MVIIIFLIVSRENGVQKMMRGKVWAFFFLSCSRKIIIIIIKKGTWPKPLAAVDYIVNAHLKVAIELVIVHVNLLCSVPEKRNWQEKIVKKRKNYENIIEKTCMYIVSVFSFVYFFFS